VSGLFSKATIFLKACQLLVALWLSKAVIQLAFQSCEEEMLHTQLKNKKMRKYFLKFDDILKSSNIYSLQVNFIMMEPNGKKARNPVPLSRTKNLRPTLG
jgi:hypothetical protein